MRQRLTGHLLCARICLLRSHPQTKWKKRSRPISNLCFPGKDWLFEQMSVHQCFRGLRRIPMYTFYDVAVNLQDWKHTHLSTSFCGWVAHFFFNPEITSHVMGAILSLKDSCLLGSHFGMGFISQTQSCRNLRFSRDASQNMLWGAVGSGEVSGRWSFWRGPGLRVGPSVLRLFR